MIPAYLLDTHVLIWAIDEPEALPPGVRKLIESGNAVVSSVSLWEMITKRRKAGAPTRNPSAWWDRHVVQRHVVVLPIKTKHIAHLENMPDYHKDPFDRMLIAQALYEGMRLITRDPAMDAYLPSLSVVWK